MITSDPIVTFHAVEAGGPSLLITKTSDHNDDCVVGLVIRQPGFDDGGIDLTRHEVEALAAYLQAALDGVI